MRVSESLAAAGVLGLEVTTQREVVERVRQGLPSEALRAIEKRLGLTHAALASLLGLPERSFARRIKTARLSHAESDVLYRIARIACSATDALGSEEKGARWLSAPNRALGDVAPIALLDTEPGAREVEDVLGRILYGIVS